jgi:hypothetical protein
MTDPKQPATALAPASPLQPSPGLHDPVGHGPAGHGPAAPSAARVPELGGPKGLEPTRYGDWERNGRCVDF